MRYRWIMYVSQNFPGNMSFDLDRVSSIAQAKDAFREFCQAVFTDDCTATLYPYDDEAWEAADRFRDSGCPFDYPSLIIERGPRGGVRVTTA